MHEKVELRIDNVLHLKQAMASMPDPVDEQLKKSPLILDVLGDDWRKTMLRYGLLVLACVALACVIPFVLPGAENAAAHVLVFAMVLMGLALIGLLVYAVRDAP